jgi:uncharacterized protein (DUF1499 family)
VEEAGDPLLLVGTRGGYRGEVQWRRSIWLSAILLAIPIGLSMSSCSVPELGLRDGRLTPLPGKPNCVSSLATDAEHRVEPLELRGDVGAARATLEQIVADLPRSVLLAEDDAYLRFQFSSFVFRFKDDLEFHLVPADGVIHLRAAARVGHSDFGVNRRRVEVVRERYDRWLADR